MEFMYNSYSEYTRYAKNDLFKVSDLINDQWTVEVTNRSHQQKSLIEVITYFRILALPYCNVLDANKD